MRKFWLILLLSLPGILCLIPTATMLYNTLSYKLPSNVIQKDHFILIVLVQAFLITALSAAVGCFLAPKIGLKDNLLESIIARKNVGKAVKTNLFPALLYSIPFAIVFLILIYAIAIPTLRPEEIGAVNNLCIKTGFLGRILYGGIVEEVIMRWGVLTFLVWLMSKVFSKTNNYIFWSAIIISSIAFAAGHVPAYTAIIKSPSTAYILSILFLNFYAGIVFGWIFWRFGLVSAMASHMTFHTLWYLFEVCFV